MSTADKLATQHGVSAPTVKRAGQFADAVDAIEKAAPGFAQTVQAGQAPTRQDVVKAASVIALIPEAATDLPLSVEFSELPPEIQNEAIAAIVERSDEAKEVMREAVKNYRSIGSGENERPLHMRLVLCGGASLIGEGTMAGFVAPCC